MRLIDMSDDCHDLVRSLLEGFGTPELSWQTIPILAFKAIFLSEDAIEARFRHPNEALAANKRWIGINDAFKWRYGDEVLIFALNAGLAKTAEEGELAFVEFGEAWALVWLAGKHEKAVLLHRGATSHETLSLIEDFLERRAAWSEGFDTIQAGKDEARRE